MYYNTASNNISITYCAANFNALFTFTICVLSAYLPVSVIPSNLLVKITCSCYIYNTSKPAVGLVRVQLFCYIPGKHCHFILYPVRLILLAACTNYYCLSEDNFRHFRQNWDNQIFDTFTFYMCGSRNVAIWNKNFISMCSKHYIIEFINHSISIWSKHRKLIFPA